MHTIAGAAERHLPWGLGGGGSTLRVLSPEHRFHQNTVTVYVAKWSFEKEQKIICRPMVLGMMEGKKRVEEIPCGLYCPSFCSLSPRFPKEANKKR